MKLETQNGMTLVSDNDLKSIHTLRRLFKNHRDTVAVIYNFQKENKDVVNLMSKMWRISDEILAEMKKMGEIDA